MGTEEKIRFTSSILPKWARRTKSLDALLPVLYLRGVSTGDFQEALAGKDAPVPYWIRPLGLLKRASPPSPRSRPRSYPVAQPLAHQPCHLRRRQALRSRLQSEPGPNPKSKSVFIPARSLSFL